MRDLKIVERTQQSEDAESELNALQFTNARFEQPALQTKLSTKSLADTVKSKASHCSKVSQASKASETSKLSEMQKSVSVEDNPYQSRLLEGRDGLEEELELKLDDL